MKSQTAASDINITFPDGSVRPYPAAVTGMDIASAISTSLAKDALAVEVDGAMWDLSRPITQDAKIRIITRKDNEALDIIRHDCAHVMAQAVQELFPGTQVTIGPNIENGFFYDFYREEPFTPDDFARIEKKMAEIIARNEPFKRMVYDRDEAIQFFKKKGEDFKVELIQDLPKTEEITL